MSLIASALAASLLFGLVSLPPADDASHSVEVTSRPTYPNLGSFVEGLKLAAGEAVDTQAKGDAAITVTGSEAAVAAAGTFAREIEENPTGIDAALPQVNVETRFFTMRRGDLQTLPDDLRIELAKTFGNGQPTVIENPLDWMKEDRLQRLDAPNVSLFSGQTSFVTISRGGGGLDWNDYRAVWSSKDFNGLALEIAATVVDDNVALHLTARLASPGNAAVKTPYDTQFTRMFVAPTGENGFSAPLVPVVAVLSEDASGRAEDDVLVLMMVRARILDIVEMPAMPELEPAK